MKREELSTALQLLATVEDALLLYPSNVNQIKVLANSYFYDFIDFGQHPELQLLGQRLIDLSNGVCSREQTFNALVTAKRYLLTV